jgi:hypothetical protein
LNWIGLDCIGLGWVGELYWIVLDCIGLDSGWRAVLLNPPQNQQRGGVSLFKSAPEKQVLGVTNVNVFPIPEPIPDLILIEVRGGYIYIYNYIYLYIHTRRTYMYIYIC